MKNIAIIVPSLKFGGGAEKVASNIGTELSKKGYNISFFTFYDEEKKYPFEGKYFSLKESIKENLFSKIIKLFTRAYKIADFYKRNNIETSISFMEDANFSLILSKLFGNKSKTIVSIRHSLFEYGKGLYFYLIKFLYNFSNKIVVLTKFEKENLINNFGIKQNKIEIIYNYIDIDKINNLKNEDLGEYKDLFNNGKITFISIGRLNKIKNQKLLIDTFLDFNKKYNNSQLVILGEGELRKTLEDLIGENKNIYLLGNKNNVYKFLYNSNCFILSSFSEAFPNVIIEAIACDLPVISSETQGGKEIIGNNEYGCLFKNNSKNNLFNAMEKIYGDEKLRNKYKEKSLERSRDLEISKIMGKWEEII